MKDVLFSENWLNWIKYMYQTNKIMQEMQNASFLDYTCFESANLSLESSQNIIMIKY
jgi:hypothetical protein